MGVIPSPSEHQDFRDRSPGRSATGEALRGAAYRELLGVVVLGAPGAAGVCLPNGQVG